MASYDGTPSQATFFELPSRTRSGHIWRVLENVRIPMDVLPVTAILQMSRVFVDDDDGSARMLCFDIQQRAEELGLLKGFSSTVIATACVHFAGFACGRDVLPDSAVQVLLPFIGAVRTSYNELWLERVKFAETVRKHGGDLQSLPGPYSRTGRAPNKQVLQQDRLRLQGPARRLSSTRVDSRSKGVQGRESRLRSVEGSEESADEELERLSIR